MEKDYLNIFKDHKSIAVIGYSDKKQRASNRIGRYLLEHGYEVTGVNPFIKEEVIDNIQVYNTIYDIPRNIDIVNIFRRSEFLYDHITEILSLNTKPKVIWTQLGVIDPEAKKLAEDNGIKYVQNKCIMVEHNKLFSE
ncbi:MAG: CoA-binding protein [Bacteroidetes bacterium]|nr:CoA-binding protein [Bacteroidota bacterium]